MFPGYLNRLPAHRPSRINVSMKKPVVIIGIILAVAGLGAAAYYWQNLRGAGPAILPPPRDIAKDLQKTPPPAPEAFYRLRRLPLKLPPGFAISIFAKKLPGARVLALDPNGNLLVSLTSQGRVVALPDKNGDGVADAVVTVLDGLDKPHGLAFGPEEKPRLYVAETGRVAAFDYDPERLTATSEQKIADLPPGGRHFTRSLRFLPGAPGPAPVDFRGLQLRRLRGGRLALRQDPGGGPRRRRS